MSSLAPWLHVEGFQDLFDQMREGESFSSSLISVMMLKSGSCAVCSRNLVQFKMFLF